MSLPDANMNAHLAALLAEFGIPIGERSGRLAFCVHGSCFSMACSGFDGAGERVGSAACRTLL
jgi:hypothetical protein